MAGIETALESLGDKKSTAAALGRLASTALATVLKTNPVGAGLLAISGGWLGRQLAPSRPQPLPGFIATGSDISIVAFQNFIAKDNNRGLLADILVDGISGYAGAELAGRLKMGSDLGQMTLTELTAMGLDRFVEKALERADNNRDNEIVSNAVLAREVHTFTSTKIRESNRVFTSGDDFKAYMAKPVAEGSALTVKFEQLWAHENKHAAKASALPVHDAIDVIAAYIDTNIAATGTAINSDALLKNTDSPLARQAGQPALMEKVAHNAINKITMDDRPWLLRDQITSAMDLRVKDRVLNQTAETKNNSGHDFSVQDAARAQFKEQFEQYKKDNPHSPLEWHRNALMIKIDGKYMGVGLAVGPDAGLAPAIGNARVLMATITPDMAKTFATGGAAAVFQSVENYVADSASLKMVPASQIELDKMTVLRRGAQPVAFNRTDGSQPNFVRQPQMPIDMPVVGGAAPAPLAPPNGNMGFTA